MSCCSVFRRSLRSVPAKSITYEMCLEASIHGSIEKTVQYIPAKFFDDEIFSNIMTCLLPHPITFYVSRNVHI